MTIPQSSAVPQDNQDPGVLKLQQSTKDPAITTDEEIIEKLKALFGEDVVSEASANVFFYRIIEEIRDLGIGNFRATTEAVIKLLGKENVTQAFVEFPYGFTRAIEEIGILGIGKFKVLIELLGKENVTQVFVKNPRGFAEAIEEIGILGIDDFVATTEAIIELLGKENVTQVFVESPRSFAIAIKEINSLGIDNFKKLISLVGRENISAVFVSSIFVFAEKILKEINEATKKGEFYSAVEEIKLAYFTDFRLSGRYSARIWQEFGILVWAEINLTPSKWKAIYSCLSNMPPEFIKDLSVIIIYSREFDVIYGEYKPEEKQIWLNWAALRQNLQLFTKILFHELAHHIDFLHFEGKAFADLYRRSVDEDFALAYGGLNHLEDFATTVENYGLDGRAQFIRAIDQALEGKPVYLEKLLFVLNLFTIGHPDYTIMYRIREDGIIVTKKVNVGKDAEGNIISIGGVNIRDLGELRKFFEGLEI